MSRMKINLKGYEPHQCNPVGCLQKGFLVFKYSVLPATIEYFCLSRVSL